MGCLRCRRKLPWSLNVLLPWPFCPEQDLDACLVEASSLEEEPVLWLDLSDVPPADAGVCHRCRGKGEVPVGQDYETRAHKVAPCEWCQATGEEPVMPGHRNHHPTESERRYSEWLGRLAAGFAP